MIQEILLWFVALTALILGIVSLATQTSGTVGPIGPSGTVGPIGPPGEPAPEPTFASIYLDTATTITAEGTLLFPAVASFHGLSTTTSTITIETAGSYSVQFWINTGSGSNQEAEFRVMKNDEVISSSQSRINITSDTLNAGGGSILSMEVGDVLSVDYSVVAGSAEFEMWHGSTFQVIQIM